MSTSKPRTTKVVVLSERPLGGDAPPKKKPKKKTRKKAPKVPPDANLPVTKGDLRKAVEDLLNARSEPATYRVTLTGYGMRRCRVDVSHIPRVGELIAFVSQRRQHRFVRVIEVQHGEWLHTAYSD